MPPPEPNDGYFLSRVSDIEEERKAKGQGKSVGNQPISRVAGWEEPEEVEDG